ncbi:MAG: nucleotidyltransferase family protein [Candidatus Omnitrophica bacterium]|nr:nucleotidyltransferase family protein [Candidatus Omnitrophota bacterium]
MRILILAAGYGTRLYPLTLNAPKPLIPINGKPVINFLLDKVKNFDSRCVKEIKVVCNGKFYKKFLRWKKNYGNKIKIVNDGSNSPEERLGAIKDIKFGIGAVKDDWLILGGDNLFEDPLSDFLKFSEKVEAHPVIGVHKLKSKKLASRFGVVVMNKDGRIEEFLEKPKEPPTNLVASCIYYFPKESLDFLDTFLAINANADASGQYIAWLIRQVNVFGYVLKGDWLDIGHYDALRLAEKKFK